jgi:hypothetical protein
MWASWLEYRASFVFVDELRGWPVVRRLGPGVLSMKAVHTGPRRMQSWGGKAPAVITGVVLAAVIFDSMTPAPHGSETSDQQFVFAIIVGVIGGFISRPVWRRLLTKTRLVIRFDQRGISWTGPDKEKHRVAPQDLAASRMGVILPHRWADDERRKQNDWMNAHRGQRSPKPLFQISSELVMQTGPGNSHWRTVAEFCNDAHGEQAGRLQSAIQLVSVKTGEELAALRRQAAASGPL